MLQYFLQSLCSEKLKGSHFKIWVELSLEETEILFINYCEIRGCHTLTFLKILQPPLILPHTQINWPMFKVGGSWLVFSLSKYTPYLKVQPIWLVSEWNISLQRFSATDIAVSKILSNSCCEFLAKNFVQKLFEKWQISTLRAQLFRKAISYNWNLLFSSLSFFTYC